MSANGTTTGYRIVWGNFTRMARRRVVGRRGQHFAEMTALITFSEDLDLRKDEIHNDTLSLSIRRAIREAVTQPIRERKDVEIPRDGVDVFLRAVYDTPRDRAEIHFRLYAAKPSVVPDRERAIEILSGAYTRPLVDIVADAVQKTLEGRAHQRHLQRIHEQANRLAGWICGIAQERAKEVTRFTQRLAALVAETDAEQEIQLRDLLRRGGAFDEGVAAQEFDPAAVEIARVYAHRMLSSSGPGVDTFSVGKSGIPFDQVQKAVEAFPQTDRDGDADGPRDD